MEFYKTLETVRLPGGTVLALTPEQARRRRHLLAPVVDGKTYALLSVEFKSGEVIGLEYVPLALKPVLEPVELTMLQEGELPPGVGKVIESTLEERPDNAEPGEQIQPESGDLAPVPESKPDAKGKGKK